MKDEKWFDIPGYSRYEINSDLQVRHRVVLKIKKLYIDEDGYFRTNISIDGKRVKPGHHRLVALAFIPNPENKPQVNHKDGNKQNNNISNLEWCTMAENKKHAMDKGLVAHKLEKEDILFIRDKYVDIGVKRLAKMFSVSEGTIYGIVAGRDKPEVGGKILESVRTKRIINIDTGAVYNSVKELSQETNISIKSYRRKLGGERKNLTPYRYIGRLYK